MENLPLLVLETICEFVSLFEPKRTSLFAFGQTSRICRDASKRERFSKVVLRTTEEDRFEQDLGHLRSELDKADSHKYVRLLRISSFKVTRRTKSTEISLSTFPQRPKGLRWEEPYNSIWHCIPPGVESYWSIDWMLLAVFISNLNLKDLIWAHKDQIPECILDILHSNLPSCRLHVHTYAIRGFHMDSKDNMEIIQDAEYKLMTSPSLYSIVGVHDRRHNWKHVTKKVVVATLEGYAPNLKHVLLRLGNVGFGTIDRNPPPWLGFKPASEELTRSKPTNKSQIWNFSMELYIVDGAALEGWYRSMEFEHLHSLTLSNEVALSGLQKMAQFSQDGIFDRLRSLVLPRIYEYARQPLEEVTQAMECLISSLKDMERLHIKDTPQEAFDAALKYHGHSLIDFEVHDLVLYTDQVTELQRRCTKLKQLHIEIVRTTGDEVEAQIYRTLGSIRTLQHLTLTLNTTSYRYIGRPDDYCLWITVPQSVEEDPILTRAFNDKVKAVFINAALDQTLATSIFTELLVANARANTDLPPTLNTIILAPRDVGALDGISVGGGSPFSLIFSQLARDWSCERDPRDTHRHVFSIEDLNEEDRKSGLADDEDFQAQLAYQCYQDVPKEIWPEAGDKWLEEWFSPPLKGEFGDEVEKMEFRRVVRVRGEESEDEVIREDYGYYGEL